MEMAGNFLGKELIRNAHENIALFGIGLDSIAHFLEALDMFPDRRSCNAKVIGQVLARYGLG